jgi:glycosyltransferase involved in cell wall biosynthesis
VIDLSIIISCYNNYDFVNNCLNSVDSIRLNNSVELIIIDDSSEDETLLKILSFAKNRTNVKVIQNDINLGVSNSRNLGILNSSGSYIGFLDCDDELNLSSLLRELDKVRFKNFSVIAYGYSSSKEVFESNLDNYSEYKIYDNGINFMIDALNSSNFTSMVWNKIYKRELLKDIHFRSNRRFEDELFTFEVLSNAKNILLIDKVFYFYRINENSFMKTNNSSQNIAKSDDLIFIFSEIMKSLSDNKLNDFVYLYERYFFLSIIDGYYKYRISNILFYLKSTNFRSPSLNILKVLMNKYTVTIIYVIKNMLKGR